MKLFQEAWEREHNCFFLDDLPPIVKYGAEL